MPDRRIAMVGFLQAQNCSNFPASWRHPESAGDFMTPEYYRRIARTLEDGKFHLAFFDDRLAMPDRFGDDFTESVRHGVRVVKMDPIPILSVMGAATSRLGLGATCSTTYYEPFHVARLFATLDHMTGGRAGWNVVTSLNDSEAANFGADGVVDHDARYDRADEFVEVVLAHWRTWAPDAIVLDKAGGMFADPSRVRRLDHRGRYFRSRGPFTVPPSPQGHPVIIQAGAERARAGVRGALGGKSSSRSTPTWSSARAHMPRPGRWRAPPGATPTASELRQPATPRWARRRPSRRTRRTSSTSSRSRWTPSRCSPRRSTSTFATKAPDEPFTDEELRSISGIQAIRDRVVRLSGNPNPTRDDFVRYSNRGTVREMPHFVGTAATVADQLQEWFERPACDGFVLAATHVPGTYEDFVRLVVPELQRRGIYHQDYAGTTLRENLGLAG